MGSLPRDENGIVTPHDDRDAIPDEADVIRYVHRMHLTPNPDGTRRLSKGAFSGSSKERDQYQGMSVDMLNELTKNRVDPASRMQPDHEGAVLIRVGDLRELGFKVGADPGQSNDPYHAAVWGVKNSHRQKIKKRCRWFIKPSNTASIE